MRFCLIAAKYQVYFCTGLGQKPGYMIETSVRSGYEVAILGASFREK